MRPTDREALATWVFTRLALGVLVAAVGAFLAAGRPVPGFLARWTQWDVALLIEIARYGYDGNPAEPPDPGLPAFFPGMPLALRAIHLVVPSWALAALLISFLAGAAAMVALARLGDLCGPRGTGPRAVLVLLVSPWAVFLFAGYTEALFLAFAVPAWLLARRGQWSLACLAAAGAATVRITGVFLAVALVVQFLAAREWRSGRWARAGWLAVPFVPPTLYSLYLYARTGDLFAWLSAQKAGWQRELTPPWESFLTTWNAAFHVTNEFTWAFRGELVAAAVGVALTVWLLAARRWGELTYVGLQVASLLSSTFYLSIPRATLLWWPLWLLVARVGLRYPWVHAAYLAVSVPLMATMAIAFTRGVWVA
ncbi:MAG: hypothetical protein GEV03_17910 [Streptosporangiales bacterium]|nr:hypothetical protein [Streptosporangiales bacterium]